MFCKERPNGLRGPTLGRGRRSRPTGKMLRRVKLLEICAESPASGARCVRWHFSLLMDLEGLDTFFKYAQFFVVFIFVGQINYAPSNISVDDNVLYLPKL